MKSLMLQRICSSFASGLKTAQKMLKHSISNEDEERIEEVEHILSEMTRRSRLPQRNRDAAFTR